MSDPGELAPSPKGVEVCSCDEAIALRRELARLQRTMRAEGLDPEAPGRVVYQKCKHCTGLVYVHRRCVHCGYRPESHVDPGDARTAAPCGYCPAPTCESDSGRGCRGASGEPGEPCCRVEP